MAEAVHIGTAAKLAGVSVDTIRFYQKLGLQLLGMPHKFEFANLLSVE